MRVGQGLETARLPDGPPQKNHVFRRRVWKHQGRGAKENVGMSDQTACRKHASFPRERGMGVQKRRHFLQLIWFNIVFLPRDASTERGDATVSRLSVRPSVCP